MGETTAIEWADHTFNGWIGCTEVSVGEKGACTGCYARELARRYGWAEWGDHPRQKTSETNWRKPLSWDRKAKAAGTRPFVFSNSLSDVFDNQVPPEWRLDLFHLMWDTPHLTWLLLTKRPQNIEKLTREIGVLRWPSNAAIGCTVVTQAEADRDIPHLLAAKAALNPAFAFVSMEPLMEVVDLDAVRIDLGGGFFGSPLGWAHKPHHDHRAFPVLDWVIAGGMTSQGKFPARPTHPDAFRSLRDLCAVSGTPFLFKQWGEWAPDGRLARDTLLAAPGYVSDLSCDSRTRIAGHGLAQAEILRRVGKKAAGRLLDGIEHNARPEPRP